MASAGVVGIVIDIFCVAPLTSFNKFSARLYFVCRVVANYSER